MVNWDEVDRLAKAHRVIDPSASEEDLLRQLRLWWCITYNKPFKEPLLDTYNIDELVYEYLCHHYINPENDPAARANSTKAQKEDDDWIAEQMKQMQAQVQPKPPPEEPPKVEIDLPPELSAKFD